MFNFMHITQSPIWFSLILHLRLSINWSIEVSVLDSTIDTVHKNMMMIQPHVLLRPAETSIITLSFALYLLLDRFEHLIYIFFPF